MEYAIELKNLCKGYTDTSGNRIEVLQDMSLVFEKGKMYGIMGVSGSGKTTLLSVMGILERFDKGELILEGKVIQNRKEHEMADIEIVLSGAGIWSSGRVSYERVSETLSNVVVRW